MGIKQRLVIAAIISYLLIYAIAGPPNVPNYSPALWWPMVAKLFFVGGILLILGMAIWNQYLKLKVNS